MAICVEVNTMGDPTRQSAEGRTWGDAIADGLIHAIATGDKALGRLALCSSVPPPWLNPR
jgi:hypothetical protein